MNPWYTRLSVKILFLAILLPFCGSIAITFGALNFLRAGLVEVTREWSDTTADILTRSIEQVMINGGADVTGKMVEDLRRKVGIKELEIFNSRGEQAFSESDESRERGALARLRVQDEAFSVRRDDMLVFYRPLRSGPECSGCHEAGKLLGAVKVAVPLEGVFRKGAEIVMPALMWSLAGVCAMGLLLWLLVRKLVVLPVKRIQEATRAIAAGDLSVDARVASRDEIGQLWASLKESLHSLSVVITRINDVSHQVAGTSDAIEKESARVVESTGLEARSFGDIAVSVEELNASVSEISDGLISLSSAAELSHSASSEMASSIAEVAQSTENLSEAVARVSSTTGEMSHTIRELSWGAEQLSQVSTETFAVVEAVEKYLRKVQENSEESETASEQVRKEAEDLGMNSVQRMLGAMEKIKNDVKNASEFVHSLGGRSKQIGKIVSIIDEINDQTSLLALNAAILAAQAGKHGKGFEVVAGEIRKLSVRTAESTVEISDLIKNVRNEVAGAVDSMKEAMLKVETGFKFAEESGRAVDTIVKSSRVSSEKASVIKTATDQQSDNLASVREAMKRLDEMTQFLAQGTTEQKREADSLYMDVEKILAAVTQIKSATEEQSHAGRQIEEAVQKVSAGMKQVSRALQDEKEGSARIKQALHTVVELPEKNRGLARNINRGLRGILGDTELLRAEVEYFKVAGDDVGNALKLGVVPLESPAQMHRRFSSLAAYLGEMLGRTVELKVALNFAGAVDDLCEGRTHLAYLTPSTYVQAKKRCDIVLLAKALRNGKPYQHAVIITKPGSNIATITDIQGRSFAFGDPNSTSSHIVPRAMLKKAGISLEDLRYYEYLGHHDDVARAVVKGEYDAGAVMESVAVERRNEGLVILAKSPPIPEFNFCASQLLPEEERKTVQQGLLALTKESNGRGEILTALYSDYSGFAEAKDADYDEIRLMIEDLGLMEADAAPVNTG